MAERERREWTSRKSTSWFYSRLYGESERKREALISDFTGKSK